MAYYDSNDRIINCSDMIMKVVNMTAFSSSKLDTTWKEVVSGIKTFNDSMDCEKRMPIGERLAGNTRVVDLSQGVLLIETDHSGWIQYLRMYQKYILTGLKRKLPDLEIRSMAFKIAGTTARLSDVKAYEEQLEKERRIQDEKIELKEKQLNKFFEKIDDNKKTTENKEYPPELLEKFESLRKTMLTNAENK